MEEEGRADEPSLSLADLVKSESDSTITVHRDSISQRNVQIFLPDIGFEYVGCLCILKHRIEGNASLGAVSIQTQISDALTQR